MVCEVNGRVLGKGEADVKKAIVYINQFFAGIGGEDQAQMEPKFFDEPIGPAMAYKQALAGIVEITHTIVCGDNFIGTNTEEAIGRILDFLRNKEFDLFFAGPAFRAGRYGVACGHVCKAVKEQFGAPAFTSMNEENPGMEMFCKDVHVFKGGASATAMKKDVAAIAEFTKKVINGQPLGCAQQEGYFGRGVRWEVFPEPPVPAADRVIDLLLKKINGEPFVSELPIPDIDRVPIAQEIVPEALRAMTVALITSGGIVPAGNPDRIQSASATKWGKYDVSDMESLKSGEFFTIHAGYDPAAGNEDPNRIMPLDVMREYEKEGKIGGVYKYFYSTVGTGTTQAEAARMGREIAAELKNEGISAAILTST